MLGLEETYAAIRSSVTGRVVASDAVRVAGPDARSYLQGQVSQDLAPLQRGGSAEALLLSPQGKLVAFVRIVLASDDELLVIVEEGFGEAVLERLSRFKIRVKATLGLERLACAEVRGPGAAAAVGRSAGLSGPDRVTMPVDWPGLSGLDVLAPALELDEAVPEGDGESFEAARIEAGQPRMGSELTESTIAAEAGLLERTVSFTKGCYPGQELVARLDARGNNVAKRLRAVVFAGSAPVGSGVVVGGHEVGTLTSVAFSPGRSASVALAYVRRGVEVPAPASVGEGGLDGEVRELPLG